MQVKQTFYERHKYQMGIIEAKNLVFEYIRRDEEGNVEGITRAIDDVNLDIRQGILLRFSVTTVLENPLLPSTLMLFIIPLKAQYGLTGRTLLMM